ncbi:hypothetical protein DV735_g417, partial [Chaetothyriales sp. CBS 134920]
MDHTQAKALAALQPFIHLAITTKNASNRVLADLITRATAAPGTYVFTELLQLPVIQRLGAPDTPAEYRAYLTVLELFSWGTYEEYKNASALESLVRSASYASLLNASLSPTSSPPAVHVHSVSPLRDLRPQSLAALLAILSTWSSRCDSVATSLQANIDTIKSTARARNTLAAVRQARIDNAVLKVHRGDAAKDGSSGGLRGSKRDLDADDAVDSDEDRMDVDEGFGGELGGPTYPSTAQAAGGGSSSAAGPSRGTKRGRPRG